MGFVRVGFCLMGFCQGGVLSDGVLSGWGLVLNSIYYDVLKKFIHF